VDFFVKKRTRNSDDRTKKGLHPFPGVKKAKDPGERIGKEASFRESKRRIRPAKKSGMGFGTGIDHTGVDRK
jgi:hypothetical protein